MCDMWLVAQNNQRVSERDYSCNSFSEYVWGLQQARQLYGFSQQLNSAFWSSGSQYLAVTSSDQATSTFLLLRAADGKQIFQATFADPNALKFMAWSPDSRYIVFPATSSNNWLAGQAWSMEIWDSQTQKKVSEIGGTLPMSRGGSFYYDVSGLAWSPDGKTIAVGIDNDIWLIDLTYDQGGPHQIRTSFLNAAAMNNTSGFALNILTWSPNNRYLAISQDHEAGFRVYDVFSGKSVFMNTAVLQSTIAGLAWSVDSRRITTVDDYNRISLWTLQ